MAKFKFNLRTPNGNVATPVNFVIRWSSNRLVYPTKETIQPRYWVKSKQAFPGGAKQTKAFAEHPEFNERLDSLITTAKATLRNYVNDHGREPTTDELRHALDLANGRIKPQPKLDLVGYYTTFVETSAGTVNKHAKPVSSTYYRRLKLTLVLLKDYIRTKHRGRNITFMDLDIAFVRGFTTYLTTTKKYATNSVGSFLKTLRMVVNTAAEDNHQVNPAFRSRRLLIPREQTESIYLNTDELEDLFHLDLTDAPRLDRVRDLFLLQCWVGVRYSDLASVTSKNVRDNCIHLRTQKTDERVIIPLHAIAAAILNKYDGNPPTISNQKFNIYLKQLARRSPSLQKTREVSITKGGERNTSTKAKWELVSSHTARRSFATNMYLSGDMPIRTIMQVTGHRSESAFVGYLRLGAEEHAQLMAQSKVFNMPVPMRLAV